MSETRTPTGATQHHDAAETEAEELSGRRASLWADAWRELVVGWSFEDVNELIERHNRWYPVEARLPMDPRRRDYALVNGRDYRLEPLDVEWALARFPAADSTVRQAAGA